jgi:hypothetical protein
MGPLLAFEFSGEVVRSRQCFKSWTHLLLNERKTTKQNFQHHPQMQDLPSSTKYIPLLFSFKILPSQSQAGLCLPVLNSRLGDVVSEPAVLSRRCLWVPKGIPRPCLQVPPSPFLTPQCQTCSLSTWLHLSVSPFLRKQVLAGVESSTILFPLGDLLWRRPNYSVQRPPITTHL